MDFINFIGAALAVLLLILALMIAVTAVVRYGIEYYFRQKRRYLLQCLADVPAGASLEMPREGL
jgi:hypothetical protein